MTLGPALVRERPVAVPSWGNMLGGVLADAFRPPWWPVIFPGVAIRLTITAANLPGDLLRDVLDREVRPPPPEAEGRPRVGGGGLGGSGRTQ